MLGWFPLLPPPPPPRHRPSSLPTTELKPTRCPSPFLRDVGPPPSLDGGQHEGKEDKRGDPWNGRPRRYVITFPTSLTATDRLSSHPRQLEHREGPNVSTVGPTTTPRANRRHRKRIDDTASESTRPQGNQRHRERIDDTASESTRPRANQRHRERIDDT
jgi:hypothetical protein